MNQSLCSVVYFYNFANDPHPHLIRNKCLSSSYFSGGSIETVENKNGIEQMEMQGVENGHATSSRGSSRPSHHEAAAEGDEDDDDEIYEPPVKSHIICLDKKSYTISFCSIYLIYKLNCVIKRKEISTHIYVHYWFIRVYNVIWYLSNLWIIFVRQMHVDIERMINYITYI